MHRSIEEVELSFFDTETTGLEPVCGDRIVEIAAIRMKGKERISQFQSLVNPQREISPAAFAVNHISSTMLQDAPLVQEVFPRFFDFVKGSYLCSYNAAFDVGFLNNELKIMGCKELEEKVVFDVLKMARRLLPREERYALWYVSEKLGLKQKQNHRALADVELTIEVFQKLKTQATERDIHSVLDFSRLFGLKSDFLRQLHTQRIAEIQQAIDLGVKLKIKYFAASNAQLTEREVIPKEIRKEHNEEYLVGYCCLRNDERSFRIDGILHLEIL